MAENQRGEIMTSQDVVFNQHPSVKVPAFLQRKGFDDDSWRNDACAKCTVDFPGTKFAKFESGLCIWVSEVEPSEREMAEDWPRFVVQHVRNEDEWTNGEAELIYEGESEADAAKAVFEMLAVAVGWSILDDVKRLDLMRSHQERYGKRCASFSQLHDVCDANMLGWSEWVADTFGLEDYGTDLLNRAQEIVDLKLQTGEI